MAGLMQWEFVLIMEGPGASWAALRITWPPAAEAAASNLMYCQLLLLLYCQRQQLRIVCGQQASASYGFIEP